MTKISELINEIDQLKSNKGQAKEASRQARIKILDDAKAAITKELKIKGLTLHDIRNDDIRFKVDGLIKAWVKIELPWRFEKMSTSVDNYVGACKIVGTVDSFTNETIRPDNIRFELDKADEGVPLAKQVENTINHANAIGILVKQLQSNAKLRQAIFDFATAVNSAYQENEADATAKDTGAQLATKRKELVKLIIDDAESKLKKGIVLPLKQVSSIVSKETAEFLGAIVDKSDWSGIPTTSLPLAEYVSGYAYGNLQRGISEYGGPVFWDRATEKAFCGSKITVKKVNAKSVSILVDESNDAKGLNVSKDTWDSNRNTSYTTSRSTYYVRKPEEGAAKKDIKSAIKYPRAILIALAYGAFDGNTADVTKALSNA